MSNSKLTCGTLRAVTDPQSSVKFSGTIALHGARSNGAALSGDLILSPNPRWKPESDGPNFDVYLRTGEGTFPVGAAWVKNSDRVSGGDFLSITLDSPGIETTNLTAFPPEDKSGFWSIVWSRPRQMKAAA